MPAPTTSKQVLGREAPAALLGVRTGPECLEGNLRELTWASKTRLWDSYHVKSPNLRHRQACSQNKGQSPSGDRQPQPEGGNRSPRETLSTKLQAGFFAN